MQGNSPFTLQTVCTLLNALGSLGRQGARASMDSAHLASRATSSDSRGSSTAPHTSGGTVGAGTSAGAEPSYLHDWRGGTRADVRFVAAGGEELPCHIQFLARYCTLFGDLLEAGSEPVEAGAAPGVQPLPTPAGPLRVDLQAFAAADVERALLAVYQPHLAEAVAASLRTPAAYAAQLDLATFLG